MERNTVQSPKENLLQSAKVLERRFIFHQDNIPKRTAKDTTESFTSKHVNVLEWSSQNRDRKPFENLGQDLKISFHKQISIQSD